MKKFTVIKSQSGTTHLEQFQNCLDQIIDSNIIKISIFISSENYHHYISLTEQFSLILTSSFLNPDVPVSFIAQSPCSGLVNIEIISSDLHNLIDFKYKRCNGLRYTKLIYSDKEEIFSASVNNTALVQEIEQQAESAFQTIQSLLETEGFTFSDIVRQWGYIGNLLGSSSSNKGRMQNYQIFNEVRTAYYDSFTWKNSYPAATGIGMDNGSMLLEVIACKVMGDSRIHALGNPLQTDAHKYSEQVLISPDKLNLAVKNTPKFERAKLIISGDIAEVYISGTAAILGEDSVRTTDAASQTRITIENILALISPDNLKKHNVSFGDKHISFKHFRVYIKNQNDYNSIKAVFDGYFADIPVIFVVADVCRAELLVEIEAYATIT